MSQNTFIPNGPTFIANVQVGTQFSANLIANAPSSYVRVTNYGDGSGSNNRPTWCLLTADTDPQVVGFNLTADPAWLAYNNGSLVLQGESQIIAIDNTVGSKRAIELQFVANTDPAGSGTFILLGVQPVAPI
jgi:hypothetical protein